MTYFYSDPAPRGDFDNFDLSRINGTKKYLEHFGNLLMLQLFAKEGSFSERQQAEKEIAICERKLSYWKRHPRYEQDAVTEGVLALRKAWAARLTPGNGQRRKS